MIRRVRSGLAALAGVAMACVAMRACVTIADAAKPKPPPIPTVPDAAGAPTTLKIGPKLARVRIDVTPGGAEILHDLVFPANALAIVGAGDASIFVAYTGQQRPLAIEATRHALDASQAIVDAGGTKLEVLDVYVRPKSAALILGPPNQAGHVVRLPRDGSAFGLRIRSALATQVTQTTRELWVMARLGVRDGAPIPLERIEVAARLGAMVRGARATLCGDGADPRPLFVHFPGYPNPTTDAGTLAPSLVTRRATDDLCIDLLI